MTPHCATLSYPDTSIFFPVPTVSVNSGAESPSMETAGGKKTPVESWEDVADNSTASGASGAGGAMGGGAAGGSHASHASTPDDEDTSMETDDNGHFVPASKPKTKVKKEVVEALTTEKEHVNVVFIGHVGEWASRRSGLDVIVL